MPRAMIPISPAPGSSGTGGTSGALSPSQTGWLRVLTGIDDVAPEPQATCGDCVMCAGAKVSGSSVLFSPDVKCCSYLPNVPNFLAGLALRGAGRDSVLARIAGRAGTTPLGLGLTHADVHGLVGAQSRFGRSTELLCPHFQVETRGCSIWDNRNAVCSTWFCKHERGALSQHFWHAVRDLLIAVEERLAYRCLIEAGLPPEQVSAVLENRSGVRETVRVATATPADDSAEVAPDPRVDPPAQGQPGWYARMWGDWQGREREWFARCAATADELGPDDLVALMDGVRHLADGVRLAWARLQHETPGPGRIGFAPREVSEIKPGLVRLVGYSEFDPLAVPSEFLDPLRRMDGRPTQQVLDEIALTYGISLGPDVLGRLNDFGLLANLDPADDLDPAAADT